MKHGLNTVYILSLLLLCFAATADSIQPQLPDELAINQEAGRSGHLMVTLHLESGEELPMLVDTGSPWTLLDKSLEPKLGKRLGTMTIGSLSGKSTADVYAAPKLFLANVLLMTGSNIATGDFKPQSSHSQMGILGLDCLRHYCIQLDFETGKMRFLNSDQLNTNELGKAFPLTFKSGHAYIKHDDIIGNSTNLIIDTGCNIDGLVNEGAISGMAAFMSECIWDGQAYTNLIVAAVDHVNVLGLDFLARHLVTLDFPHRTIYLKQTSIGSLAGDFWMAVSKGEHKQIVALYESEREKGQLPGLSKDDKGTLYLKSFSNFDSQPLNAKGASALKEKFSAEQKSVSFDFQKNGDSSIYHYVIGRKSPDSSWNLQKAWQTDSNGRTVKEFSVD